MDHPNSSTYFVELSNFFLFHFFVSNSFIFLQVKNIKNIHGNKKKKETFIEIKFNLRVLLALWRLYKFHWSIMSFSTIQILLFFLSERKNNDYFLYVCSMHRGFIKNFFLFLQFFFSTLNHIILHHYQQQNRLLLECAKNGFFIKYFVRFIFSQFWPSEFKWFIKIGIDKNWTNKIISL